MSDLSPAFDTLANVVAAQLKEESTDQKWLGEFEQVG
jgi:hypothetical protein